MDDSNDITALFGKAVEHHNHGRLAQALPLYDAVIRLDRAFVPAHTNRGVVLQSLKRFDEALQSYGRAIELKPDSVLAYINIGNALSDLRRFEEAVQSYNCAIELKPDYADAYNNRGNALGNLKRFDEAIHSYNRAIELKPDSAAAYSNRGNTLRDLKRFDEALKSYNRAIELKPDYAEAYHNRGNSLFDLKRIDEALLSYDRAIALKPDYAEAYYNKGLALKGLRCWDEAIINYEKALAIKPDIQFVLGQLLHAKMQICDFSDLADETEELLQDFGKERNLCEPFQMLGISGSPELQIKAAELFVRTLHPWQAILPIIPKCAPHEKIRLGYFSADYYDHATMHLMAELFELHDKSRFELIAFSFGPEKNDEMRTRVVRAFDQFIDVRNQSDRNVALLSRSMEVDIAIDLKGFTQDGRTGIFAHRAAPIQVNYLGYPGTMGADYIDYIVADPTLIPEENKPHYREKLVYLPNSYQVNDRKRPISDSALDRAELGLPPTGFVFCCFNNNFKITQSVFECWMRILMQVEGSVLWLLADNKWAAKNLKSKALAAGVNEERIIFGQRLPLGDHLARLRSADLFLDTLPYNAHTTASETLWAGLPVLTCKGEAFASRVAASLLNAVGLPELVTTTLEAYEALAIDLARHPDQLAAIKQKLAGNRITSPLFDTELFAKHLEAAYAAIYERYQADLAPDDIYIRA
jgi:protein O-GlcNAc transferase